MGDFYFVQLPWGAYEHRNGWTIARRDANGDWWTCDDCPHPMEREYFQAIGDMIPVPTDGNHLSIHW